MAGTLSVQKIQGLATSATPTVVEVSSGHTLHQAGAVLQVLQEAKTAAVTVSNGANSDIITKAITPKFSSSKILVRCSLSLAGALNSYGYCRLFRDSTAVGVGDQASGSQVNASFEVMTKNWTYQGYRQSRHTFEFLDSPSTTSATTYKINMACTSGTVYLNRSDTVVTDNVWTPSQMSTFTLIEVAQ